MRNNFRGQLIYILSIFTANLIMCGFLFVGMCVTCIIKSDLRRQRAQTDKRDIPSVTINSPLLSGSNQPSNKILNFSVPKRN
jgi:hypothetical protein